MTNEEAISHLRGYLDTEIYTDRCAEAHQIAVEAVEKQIPKKATDKEYVPNGRLVYGRCPICNTFTDNYKAYCNKCGQTIDWSDKQ